jgi:hypothetical protein
MCLKERNLLHKHKPFYNEFNWYHIEHNIVDLRLFAHLKRRKTMFDHDVENDKAPDNLDSQEMEPIIQSYLTNPELIEATERVDDELEALENIADFIIDNFDDIADGNVSTEGLWEDYHEQFGRMESPENIDITPFEPSTPVDNPAPETPSTPEPGDLNWGPSETGVKYPDPERKEGNIGGPERLG